MLSPMDAAGSSTDSMAIPLKGSASSDTVDSALPPVSNPSASPSEDAPLADRKGPTPSWPVRMRHRLLELASRHRWALAVAAIYLLPILVISRLEFVAAAGQYPQGTNALNAFLIYDHWRNYPLQAWFYPWTDWGELNAGYTGVNVLYLGLWTFNISTLIRLIELGSFWASGCTMYAFTRGLRANRLGAFTAGLFYLLLQQTPQFFEGHVPTMIALAIAPLFLLALHRVGTGPRLGWSLALALLTYLLASIGDLSVLYFLLCFGIPLFCYDTLRSGWFHHFNRSHLISLGAATGLFLIIMTPWWLPFAVGAHPKFVTNALGLIPSFASTDGESLAIAFQGIVQEGAFSTIVYGKPTYAANLGALGLLYYLVPAASIVYLILRRSLDKILLFAAGLLAIIISTAGIYPGLSTFNTLLYDHLPFFDYIPDLRLWLEITVIVYAIFIGWIVTDLSTALATLASRAPAALNLASTEPVLIEEEIEWASDGRIVRRRRVWAPPSASPIRIGPFRVPKSLTWVLPVVLCGVLLGTVLLENSEVFTAPPVLFSFPEQYVSGFDYIGNQPDRGGLLAIPFSAIYERTPWGGVSVSTLVMSTYFTRDNAVVFEGGNPYSAAMDDFLANSLFDGYSNNLSKFLAGSNVQWVTATNYTNWSYSSSGYYDPSASYERLSQQVGLGAPVYSGDVQTVYELPNVAGNVSFHPSYLVYYGSTSLINEVTNEPSYNGTQVLIDGSGLSGSALVDFVEHSSGLWGNSANISSLPTELLSAAISYGVPVAVVLGPDEVQTIPVRTRRVVVHNQQCCRRTTSRQRGIARLHLPPVEPSGGRRLISPGRYPCVLRAGDATHDLERWRHVHIPLQRARYPISDVQPRGRRRDGPRTPRYRQRILGGRRPLSHLDARAIHHISAIPSVQQRP